MAKNETKKLTPAQLLDDESSYTGLLTLKNYTPNNPTYSTEAITTSYTNMNAKKAAAEQARQASETADDDYIAAQWDFHNRILGMKDQVSGQYGPSSNEVQVVGRKKKSEYKTPRRRGPKNGGQK